MPLIDRPAVQCIQPPNTATAWSTEWGDGCCPPPRRASRVGEHLQVLTGSGWRVNLRGRPEVAVTLRGRRSPAEAEPAENEDTVARVFGSLINEQGYVKAGRRMGIRINVGRVPTQEELVEAARRDGLSVIYLEVSRAER